MIIELIAKLYDIVTITIHNESINIEGHIKYELSSNHLNRLIVGFKFSLELSQLSHHMLDHTHRILIQGKCHQILSYVVEESDCIL
jgi:hypothetical protein